MTAGLWTSLGQPISQADGAVLYSTVYNSLGTICMYYLALTTTQVITEMSYMQHLLQQSMAAEICTALYRAAAVLMS